MPTFSELDDECQNQCEYLWIGEFENIELEDGYLLKYLGIGSFL